MRPSTKNFIVAVMLAVGPAAGPAATPAAAQIVFNEILPAPSTDWNSDGSFSSSEDEWIELINAGPDSVDTDGWFLTDATGTPRFGLAGPLAPGEPLFVTGELSADWESANGFSAVGLSLNNSGDTLELFQVAGGTTTSVDLVEYGSLAADVSWGRDPDGTGAWRAFDLFDGGSGGQPTPGSPNDGLASPKILSAEVMPSFVTSADTILVCARAGDADGIESAVVRLRIDGGAWAEEAMTLVEGPPELGEWEWSLAPQAAGTQVGIVVRVSDGSLLAETNEFPFTVAGAETPVTLNEILADPPPDLAGDANGDGVRGGSDDEFVELYNPSGSPVDLTGWTLEDGTGLRHEFAAGLVLAPGALHVVFGGGEPAGIPSSWEIASTGGLSLNNSGESVRLIGPDAAPRDVHEWGTEGNANESLIRVPDGTGDWTRPSDEALGWAFSPGRPNAVVTSLEVRSWASIKSLYRD